MGEFNCALCPTCDLPISQSDIFTEPSIRELSHCTMPKQTHKEVKHTPSLTFTLEMSNQYFNTIDKSNSLSYRRLI